MPYQTLILSNEPSQCAVKIVAAKTSETTELGSLTSIKIKRRLSGTILWTTIKTVALSTLADLSFSAYDYNVKSLVTYDYGLFPVEGTTEGVGVVDDVACEFESLYISDSSATYITRLNMRFECQKNTNIVIVPTLYNQYPYAIANGLANYSTGSAAGLFLPFDTNGVPTTTGYRTFKDGFLDFLTNGKPKSIKTPDGRAWYVVVGANPKEEYNDFYEAAIISFDWTEIGPFPTTGVTTIA